MTVDDEDDSEDDDDDDRMIKAPNDVKHMESYVGSQDD
jgi:hypothetical protein